MISISLFIGMSLAVLVTVSLNSVIASQRFDTFSIDTKLSGEKNFMGDYVLPKDSIKLGNETQNLSVK